MSIEDCNCKIDVPNIFTPNNDGINDKLLLKFDCNYEEFSLQLFNRWGEEISKSNHPDPKWKGRYQGSRVSDGNYNYIIHYKLKGEKTKRLTGNITVMN